MEVFLLLRADPQARGILSQHPVKMSEAVLCSSTGPGLDSGKHLTMCCSFCFPEQGVFVTRAPGLLSLCKGWGSVGEFPAGEGGSPWELEQVQESPIAQGTLAPAPLSRTDGRPWARHIPCTWCFPSPRNVLEPAGLLF